MLTESCPIDYNTIDEHVARLNGFFTVILLCVAYFIQPFLYLIILLDFLLRVLKTQYSPVAQFSKLILNLLHIKPVPIDRAPKLFAAKIGFIMSMLLIIFFAASLKPALTITLIFFLFAASLESFFNYCLGCKIYTLLVSIGIIKPQTTKK